MRQKYLKNIEKRIDEEFGSFKKNCRCGWGVGPGWAPLLYTLMCTMRDECKWNHDPEFTCLQVNQVKEKFGTLRFYWTYLGAPEGVSDEDSERLYKWLDSFIETAEAFSGRICEICGDPGKVNDDGGWLLCLCPKCTKLRDKNKLNQPPFWKRVRDIPSNILRKLMGHHRYFNWRHNRWRKTLKKRNPELWDKYYGPKGEFKDD